MYVAIAWPYSPLSAFFEQISTYGWIFSSAQFLIMSRTALSAQIKLLSTASVLILANVFRSPIELLAYKHNQSKTVEAKWRALLKM